MTNPSTRTPETVTYQDILKKHSERERLTLIEDFENAIIAEIITSVPLDQEFEVTYLNEKGKSVTKKITDELIIMTPELDEWTREQAQKSRQRIAYGTGNFTVSQKELEDDPSLLITYAQLRRQYLAEQKGLVKTQAGKKSEPTSKKQTQKTGTSTNGPSKKSPASVAPTPTNSEPQRPISRGNETTPTTNISDPSTPDVSSTLVSETTPHHQP